MSTAATLLLPADQLDCAIRCAEEVLAALHLARTDNIEGNGYGAVGALLLAETPAQTLELLISAMLIVRRTSASKGFRS